MLKLHSCTVGIFKFGSNVMSDGALLLSCRGGVRKSEGFLLGGGSCVRNPASLILTSGSAVHPFVVVPPGTEAQRVTRPGTFPATAVAWNEEIVSKAMR